MDDNQGFTLKEVCEKTGLSHNIVRTYIREFRLEVPRTGGGHRRFTNDNIDLLLRIRDKVQKDGWTYKQVTAWLFGGEAPMQSSAETAGVAEAAEDSYPSLHEKIHALEKRLAILGDQLQQVMASLVERQETAAAMVSFPVKQEHVNDYITVERVKAQLREDALKAWAEIPAVKRTVRTGLFSRQEDPLKREFYIASHIRGRLAAELSRAFEAASDYEIADGTGSG